MFKNSIYFPNEIFNFTAEKSDCILHGQVFVNIYEYICDGIASLGNMQISNSRLGESSKCWVYSAVNQPW